MNFSSMIEISFNPWKVADPISFSLLQKRERSGFPFLLFPYQSLCMPSYKTMFFVITDTKSDTSLLVIVVQAGPQLPSYPTISLRVPSVVYNCVCTSPKFEIACEQRGPHAFQIQLNL